MYQLVKPHQQLTTQQQALQQLITQAWSEHKIITLWQAYDQDYFLRNTTEEIVWQTSIRLKNPHVSTLIKTRSYDQHDTIEIFILTPDKPRIFAATTACLEQLQLNILDAKISITANGEALNTYIVNGASPNQNEIISKLEIQLNDLDDITCYCPVITPRKMKLFETRPSIKFQINIPQNHTIMELNTHDRPGLLSAIAQHFLQCNIQLINAKLTTLGDQVDDIFFISNNGKVLKEQEQSQLQQIIIEGLTH